MFLFVLIAAGFVAPAVAQLRAPPQKTETSETVSPANTATTKDATSAAAVALPQTPALPPKPDPKAEAIKLLGRKQFALACLLLKDSYPDDTKDFSVLFLRARCSMGLRDYDRAVDFYERVVKLQPDSDRAKEELEKAQKLWRAQRQIKYLRVETGITYDTNINSGPQSDQIIIGGIPINLGEGPEAALGYVMSGSAGYIYALDKKLSLNARASVSHTDYFHGSDNATDSFSVSFGPTWNFGKTQLSLSPGYSWQGFGGSAYSSSIDLFGRLNVKLPEDSSFFVNFSANKNNYRTVPEKNGISYSASPGITFKLPQEMTGTMNLILRFENDEASYYSHDAFGFRFALNQKVAKGFETNMSYQLLEKNYESADGLFTLVPRNDEQQVISAGMTFDISGLTSVRSTDLNLKYQFIQTKSNVSIYSLDRHIMTVSVSKIW